MNVRRKSHRRTRRAFTLLEIMVVVVIIALLAGLVMQQVFSHYGRSQVRVAQSRAAQIASEVRIYLMDHSMSRPPATFDLQNLVDAGRLKEKDVLDPWGNFFLLIAPGIENPDTFDIVSYGADGQPGGEGDDADIVH